MIIKISKQLKKEFNFNLILRYEQRLTFKKNIKFKNLLAKKMFKQSFPHKNAILLVIQIEREKLKITRYPKSNRCV